MQVADQPELRQVKPSKVHDNKCITLSTSQESERKTSTGAYKPVFKRVGASKNHTKFAAWLLRFRKDISHADSDVMCVTGFACTLQVVRHPSR